MSEKWFMIKGMTLEEFITCSQCGAIFKRIKGMLCEECLRLETEFIGQVKDFILDHPKISLRQAIQRLIADPRWEARLLHTTEFHKFDLPMTAECLLCSREVEKGLMCPQCQEELNQKIEELRRMVLLEKQAREEPRDHGLPNKEGDPGERRGEHKIYAGKTPNLSPAQTGERGRRVPLRGKRK